MSAELKPGMSHEIERHVTEDLSAQKVFPHVPNVYATRAMVGHFEEVCAEMVLPYLGDGEQTVGIGMKLTRWIRSARPLINALSSMPTSSTLGWPKKPKKHRY
ncbi:MAG: hypothetical protein P8X67_16875 [Syntrophobacterales bacterium]